MRRLASAGIGIQVALLVLATSAISVGIVAVGVIAVGRDTFAALMAEHGVSTTAANDMFDRSVSVVIVGALLLAGLAAIVFSVLVARRLAAPLRDVSAAAQRIAEGDYAARVEPLGAAEVASLANSFNQMAARLEAQEQIRRRLHRQRRHELRTPLTNLQGYLEALRDGVIVAGPGDVRIPARTRSNGWSDCPTRSTRWPAGMTLRRTAAAARSSTSPPRCGRRSSSPAPAWNGPASDSPGRRHRTCRRAPNRTPWRRSWATCSERRPVHARRRPRSGAGRAPARPIARVERRNTGDGIPRG